jgi:nucleotide-binding universal stress UspA family protein
MVTVNKPQKHQITYKYHGSNDQTMFKNIHAAIDGSPSSIKALDLAAHLANQDKATLHIITAAEPLPPVVLPTAPETSYYPQYQENLRQALEKTQKNEVARLKKQYPDLNIDAKVYDGRAVHVIHEHTKDSNLIVIGHRGHGAILSMVLGSVAKQIVDICTAPVLVVKDKDYCPQ